MIQNYNSGSYESTDLMLARQTTKQNASVALPLTLPLFSQTLPCFLAHPPTLFLQDIHSYTPNPSPRHPYSLSLRHHLPHTFTHSHTSSHIPSPNPLHLPLTHPLHISRTSCLPIHLHICSPILSHQATHPSLLTFLSSPTYSSFLSSTQTHILA